jgi:hypothetical protein
MRADNSHHLIIAARRRAAATRKRAVTALRRMDTTGTPITIDAVAKQARVSRSWLYNQPDLRAEIERLRTRHHPAAAGRTGPDRQHASDASLYAASSPPPNASNAWRPRTSNSAKRSLTHSANNERPRSSATPTTRRERSPPP